MRKQKAEGDGMGDTVREGNYAAYGVQAAENGMIFTFEAEKEDECRILFYGKDMEITDAVSVPRRYCRGAIRSVRVGGKSAAKLRYNYERNGEVFTDPYASRMIGREKWGDTARSALGYRVCGGYAAPDFDWGADAAPEVPRHAMVMYKLHIRGFSMDAGIRGRERGTFSAVRARIPYLKKLGVTTVELMPVYEFEEFLLPKPPVLPDYVKWEMQEEDVILPQAVAEAPKLNYWGYTAGNYFAVKSSYASTTDASREFKELVKELHANGMECVMEMFFAEGENQNLILDALRYWMREYHVDGFHLLGQKLPVTQIAQDAWLRRTKIFYTGFDAMLLDAPCRYPHLFVYSEEYLYPVRAMLNRRDGSMEQFLCQQRKQHAVQGFVNYIADNNGFRLLDLFSYDGKHNEANGEENRDGSNWNLSYNYGAEGRTAKRQINAVRERQLCNAIAALMLGQGVPLLFAGDETGDSQSGNNNAYCQDNKTGWVNWKKDEKYAWLTAFTARMTAFRREHPVICGEQPRQLSDFGRKGFPDLSYHGEQAWLSALAEGQQAVGVMYCGAYETRADGSSDDMVYVGYNFHMGTARLALPKLPDGKCWYLCMDTARGKDAFLPEPKVQEEMQIAVRGQSVVILTGK